MAQASIKSGQLGTPIVPMWRIIYDKIRQDDVFLRASGLAYSTISSLVPVVAIILSILSGPAFQDKRDKVLDWVSESFVPVDPNDQLGISSDYREGIKELFESKIKIFADKLGAVSVLGFLVLMVTAGLLFNTVSNAFNAIWRVVTLRAFFNRVAIATALIFWGPVMLAVSISVGEYFQAFPILGTYLVPAVLSTLAFTAFFMVMPHAKVRFHCALVGGIVTAMLWEVLKLAFVMYVTRVVSYYRVYGSLGLIPMLFLWVYLNWVLILTGAEIAYCLQHHRAMAEEWLSAERQKRALAEHDLTPPTPVIVLAAAIEIARHFKSPGCRGVHVSQLAQALQIDHGRARRAANWLVGGGILARVEAPNPDDIAQAEDPAYLPACQPDSCKVSTLFSATLEERNVVGDGPAWERARELIQSLSTLDSSKFAALTLADLAKDRPRESSAAQSASGSSLLQPT